MWAKPVRIKGWAFSVGIPRTWFFGYQCAVPTNLVICIIPFIALQIDWTYAGVS